MVRRAAAEHDNPEYKARRAAEILQQRVKSGYMLPDGRYNPEWAKRFREQELTKLREWQTRLRAKRHLRSQARTVMKMQKIAELYPNVVKMKSNPKFEPVFNEVKMLTKWYARKRALAEREREGLEVIPVEDVEARKHYAERKETERRMMQFYDRSDFFNNPELDTLPIPGPRLVKITAAPPAPQQAVLTGPLPTPPPSPKKPRLARVRSVKHDKAGAPLLPNLKADPIRLRKVVPALVPSHGLRRQSACLSKEEMVEATLSQRMMPPPPPPMKVVNDVELTRARKRQEEREKRFIRMDDIASFIRHNRKTPLDGSNPSDTPKTFDENPFDRPVRPLLSPS